MRHRLQVWLVGSRKWRVHIHLTAGGGPHEGKSEPEMGCWASCTGGCPCQAQSRPLVGG